MGGRHDALVTWMLYPWLPEPPLLPVAIRSECCYFELLGLQVVCLGGRRAGPLLEG